jgi:hypothetical protein
MDGVLHTQLLRPHGVTAFELTRVAATVATGVRAASPALEGRLLRLTGLAAGDKTRSASAVASRVSSDEL